MLQPLKFKQWGLGTHKETKESGAIEIQQKPSCCLSGVQLHQLCQDFPLLLQHKQRFLIKVSLSRGWKGKANKMAAGFKATLDCPAAGRQLFCFFRGKFWSDSNCTSQRTSKKQASLLLLSRTVPAPSSFNTAKRSRGTSELLSTPP